ANGLRGAVNAIDPALPVDVNTMGQRVNRVVARPRFDAALVGLFAGMGLLLAAIGLYGVMASLVAQRTQEIGVRMALGASPGTIAAMVLGRATRWIALGTLLGLAGSLAAARSIESLLFGLHARDARSLAIACAVLAAVGLVAAWLPARRAAAVDPM